MIRGFRLYLEGFRFWLRHRPLVRISFIPLIVNITCVTTILALTVTHVPDLAARILPSPSVWYLAIVYYGGMVVLGGIALLTSFIMASLLANLLNIPFYDYLAERALILHGTIKPTGHGLRFWMTRTGKNLAAMARKLVVICFLSVLILILNLIPGLSLLVIPIGALVLTSDLLDFSFDQFAMTFSERMHFYRSNFLTIVGFAAGVAVVSAIPVINLIAMPGQVVAASFLLGSHRGRSGS